MIFKTFQLSDNLIYNSPSNYNINELKQLRNENPFRKTIGHININLVRNKFESLVDLASPNLDVLMTSETKTDERFPWRDFLYLLYVREEIPRKCIKGITVSDSFDGLFIELSLRNKKWLLGY